MNSRGVQNQSGQFQCEHGNPRVNGKTPFCPTCGYYPRCVQCGAETHTSASHMIGMAEDAWALVANYEVGRLDVRCEQWLTAGQAIILANQLIEFANAPFGSADGAAPEAKLVLLHAGSPA